MNAKVAREKAIFIQSNRINSEYVKVKVAISDKVEDGKLELIYDDTLCNEVVNLLRDEGYVIRSFQSGMNENSTEIKW